MKKYKGCVYFLKHIGMSAVKIGMSVTDDLNHRMSAYKTASPYGIEILGTIPSDTPLKIEQEIHKKLKSFRLKGEWFEITPEMVSAYIDMYSNADSIALRNEIELKMNKIQMNQDIEEVDLSELHIYHYKDRGLGFVILNQNEIFKKHSIKEIHRVQLSEYMKENKFKYRAYSTDGILKKGYKMHL